jgi:hypothetical protein
MPNADIGANNAVWIGIEPTYGTPSDPTAAGVGVWMPILDEALVYTETKYYSPQIREQAVRNAVVPAPYHVEGPIHFEVDVNYLPYLLYASRHTVVKTGAGPYTYTATPTAAGATYPGGTAKGLSIAVKRNGVGFLYGGCVIGSWSFTINDGVLECTAQVVGLSETDPAATLVGVPTWIDAELFGADAHSVYVDTAGLTPAFASRSVEFNGFTFEINHNATAQNRINPSRAANYIAYGETEPTTTTELDFLDKTEYNDFKASTLRAIKLESLRPGGMAATFAGATEAVQLIQYRTAYDSYTVETRGMADLVSAATTIRGLGISGGSAYKIVCKSPVNIT